jgi:ABC-type sugar transport system ATPase subunit
MILDLIRDLKAQGYSMIVVAHNYVHILEICDRVNLLQHGRITFDRPTAKTSVEELTDPVAAEYRAAKANRASGASPSPGAAASDTDA